MANDFITIGCGLPIDTTRRNDRLDECSLDIDGNICIYDRLETEGVLLLYEHIGNVFYTDNKHISISNSTCQIIIYNFRIAGF